MKIGIGLLALFAATAVAAQDVPLFTQDFPPEEFCARREKIYDALGGRALALVQGAPSPVGFVRFRQSNEFYYLCGVESPHSYLLLDAARRSGSLYLPHRNERREASEGKLLSAEDTELAKRRTSPALWCTSQRSCSSTSRRRASTRSPERGSTRPWRVWPNKGSPFS